MCAAVAEDRRWAKKYPWLGEEPVPTNACISEEIYQQEVEKVFKNIRANYFFLIPRETTTTTNRKQRRLHFLDVKLIQNNYKMHPFF